MSIHRYMSAQERFDAQSIPVTESGCWIWLGSTVKGYGQFQPSTKGRQLAHRYALEQKLGRGIEPGKFACHKCDTPLCVNPDHLYEGTIQSNSDDKVARGRQSTGDRVKHRNRGESHYAAKLTESDVIAIRASSESPTNLARIYRISTTAILRALNGVTWKHIKSEKAA